MGGVAAGSGAGELAGGDGGAVVVVVDVWVGSAAVVVVAAGVVALVAAVVVAALVADVVAALVVVASAAAAAEQSTGSGNAVTSTMASDVAVEIRISIWSQKTCGAVQTFPESGVGWIPHHVGGPMSRLIRMDQTGHTTLAEWTAEDPASVEAAVQAFRAELDRGYFAVVSRGEGQAEQVAELPLGESVVILRRPIAGG